MAKVTIRGITYKSHQEASEALGVTRAAVSVAVKRNKLDGVGLRETGPKKFAFEVGPFKFKSYAACDRYLGASQGYTANVLRRGSVEEKRGLIRKLIKTKAEQELQNDVSRSAA